MKELKLLNPENVSEEDAATYSLREAARAVVVDENKLIALMLVSNEKYYKLPGGGVDEGEEQIVGLKRECREELGCEIEIIGEIGYMVEYWKPQTEKQTSFCYFAKVVGEKGTTELTEGEKQRGFVPVWLSYEDVKHAISESTPTTYEGKYIVPRDLAFLEEAKQYSNYLI